MNKFETDLAKVRGLGSAHTGTSHFRMQRLTALANIFLGSFIVWLVLILAGKPHNEIVACISTPFVSTLLMMAIASIFYHMKLGMQVIIEDYAHNKFWHSIFLALNLFFCIALFAISFVSIIRIIT